MLFKMPLRFQTTKVIWRVLPLTSKQQLRIPAIEVSNVEILPKTSF